MEKKTSQFGMGSSFTMCFVVEWHKIWMLQSLSRFYHLRIGYPGVARSLQAVKVGDLGIFFSWSLGLVMWGIRVSQFWNKRYFDERSHGYFDYLRFLMDAFSILAGDWLRHIGIMVTRRFHCKGTACTDHVIVSWYW